ncbi:hypothetical protein [Actinoplanes sp. NPDC048796]|uniref:hypothetical protein n=1 Tax=unclassified Actinoplanes TaxID=2626549 RepID=UPI0034005EEC
MMTLLTNRAGLWAPHQPMRPRAWPGVQHGDQDSQDTQAWLGYVVYRVLIRQSPAA